MPIGHCLLNSALYVQFYTGTQLHTWASSGVFTVSQCYPSLPVTVSDFFSSLPPFSVSCPLFTVSASASWRHLLVLVPCFEWSSACWCTHTVLWAVACSYAGFSGMYIVMPAPTTSHWPASHSHSADRYPFQVWGGTLCCSFKHTIHALWCPLSPLFSVSIDVVGRSLLCLLWSSIGQR